MFLYFKVSSPLGNYKREVMAEEMNSVIDQVHQHDVCHSGVFKTYRKVWLISLVFENIFWLLLDVCHSVVFKTHLKVIFILFMYLFLEADFD